MDAMVVMVVAGAAETMVRRVPLIYQEVEGK
jgi:hypothetical protein